MFSFKQLEAVYWIEREGSFAAAAERLHTTQAAISKRVKELEKLLGTALFDRSQRQARLTEQGRQVQGIARDLIARRDAALEGLARPEALARTVRIGVTELIAMTWLPRLLTQVRARYPRVSIQPDVGDGARLCERLEADELDLALVPDAFAFAGFAPVRLGSAAFAWMCRPGLVREPQPLSAWALAAYPQLVQSRASGLGLLVQGWLDEHLTEAVQPPIAANSLLPLIGLTVAGAGISYMPRDCLRPLVDSGALAVLQTEVAGPAVGYVALYKPGLRSIVVPDICEMARGCCDFSTLFQGG